MTPATETLLTNFGFNYSAAVKLDMAKFITTNLANETTKCNQWNLSNAGRPPDYLDARLQSEYITISFALPADIDPLELKFELT
jgi:hypothetical protein